MAQVVGPHLPRHPSPFRRAYKAPKQPQHHQSTAPTPDPYYGHEETAKICSRYVSHIFTCPDMPPPSASAPPPSAPPSSLAHFIAYALHRTRLHPSVTYTALALLQRLKTRFPAARGSSGHRLFLSAFMIASKVVCDDTYSNKSWAVVGQGLFALREINQMEREMCAYLEWHLNVPPEDLRKFEKEVRTIYCQPPPYAHTGLTPLSIAAGPGPEKDDKLQPQQLPTPTDMGLTQMPFSARHPGAAEPSPIKPAHAVPSASSSMTSLVKPPASRAHSYPYPSPPSTPSSPMSGSGSSLSSPASSEASLPTPPSASVDTHHPHHNTHPHSHHPHPHHHHHAAAKVVVHTAATQHAPHFPHHPHGGGAAIAMLDDAGAGALVLDAQDVEAQKAALQDAFEHLVMKTHAVPCAW